jgi:hypothetical protein
MSTNFLVFNPNLANAEDDAQYTADAQRSGGATTNSIFASVLANKAFYQWSTFVTAFANMLAAKGYSTSDSNLGALATVLSNILTNADMPLPISKGGIGAVSFQAAGLLTTNQLSSLAQIIYRFDQKGMTVNGAVINLSLPGSGAYLVRAEAAMSLTTGTPSLSVSVGWDQTIAGTSTSYSAIVIPSFGFPTSGGSSSGSAMIFVDSVLSLTVSAAWSAGGGTSVYDLHVRVEQL